MAVAISTLLDQFYVARGEVSTNSPVPPADVLILFNEALPKLVGQFGLQGEQDTTVTAGETHVDAPTGLTRVVTAEWFTSATTFHTLRIERRRNLYRGFYGTGTPRRIAFWNDKFLFDQFPSRAGTFRISYFYEAAALSGTAGSVPLPKEYADALVHYALGKNLTVTDGMIQVGPVEVQEFARLTKKYEKWCRDMLGSRATTVQIER